MNSGFFRPFTIEGAAAQVELVDAVDRIINDTRPSDRYAALYLSQPGEDIINGLCYQEDRRLSNGFLIRNACSPWELKQQTYILDEHSGAGLVITRTETPSHEQSIKLRPESSSPEHGVHLANQIAMQVIELAQQFNY